MNSNTAMMASDAVMGAPENGSPTILNTAGDGAWLTKAIANFKHSVELASGEEHFTAAELETVYSLGYRKIDRSNFEEALPIFAFLTEHAPVNVNYLTGLAICMQQLGHHGQAIGVYSLVGLLDPGAVEASLRIAECHLVLKDIAAAVPLLELLVRQGQESAKSTSGKTVRTGSSKTTLHAVAVKADALLTLLDGTRPRRF